MSAKIKLFTVFMCFIWFCIFVWVLSISLPYNALSEFSNTSKKNVKIFLPEGWGFFTRNPQEVRTYFLVKVNGKFIQDNRLRNATFSNAWGLKRIGRTITVIYMQNIMPLIKNTMWHTVTDVEFSKLNIQKEQGQLISVPIKAKRSKFNMPKELIIIQKKIVPWPFRNFENRTGDSVKFVKFKINYIDK